MDLRAEISRFYINSMLAEFRLSEGSDNLCEYSSYTTTYLTLIHYRKGSTVGSLSKALGIGKSTVSKKVEDMVKKGLVRKERDPDDGRIMRLSLMPEMEGFVLSHDEIYQEAVDSIKEKISPDEMNTACKVLRTLSDELSRL